MDTDIERDVKAALEHCMHLDTSLVSIERGPVASDRRPVYVVLRCDACGDRWRYARTLSGDVQGSHTP